MLVAFAKNQMMVAKKLAGQSIIYTDPHPVGDANYCEATLLVPVLFTQNPGTVTLTVQGV